MDLSKIKLIVTDMDGTLLNSQGELDAGFFPLFKKLKNNNLNFAVASGRQYYSLLGKFPDLQEEIVFIAENGAIVMEAGKQKHMQPIARERAMEVVQKVKEIGGKFLVLCGRKSAYIEQTDPQFMDSFLRHYDKYKVVPDLLKVEGDDFLKITICDLSGAEENCYPHVKHLADEFQVKLSGEIWIDFTHKKAHKGNALKKLQKLKGITAEETVTFGDYFNDVEMFHQSAYSFAMENAHQEVKNAAKYAARSNNDLGVQQVLEELVQGLENKK